MCLYDLYGLINLNFKVKVIHKGFTYIRDI